MAVGVRRRDSSRCGKGSNGDNLNRYVGCRSIEQKKPAERTSTLPAQPHHSHGNTTLLNSSRAPIHPAPRSFSNTGDCDPTAPESARDPNMGIGSTAGWQPSAIRLAVTSPLTVVAGSDVASSGKTVVSEPRANAAHFSSLAWRLGGRPTQG